jgi:hypothetical protein
MLTLFVLAAVLALIFVAATFRQWRHGNRWSAAAAGAIAILFTLATADIALQFKTATPSDLIRQPVPLYLRGL